MKERNKTGIIRIYNAFCYSMSGFKVALKYETAFRQDCILIILMFLSFIYFDIKLIELFLLIIVSGILLITELLNSAIEWTVDLVTLERNPLAKAGKDLASAAVFIALLILLLIYFLIILL